MSQPDFWKNQEQAKEVSRELNALKDEAEKWEMIKKELADLEEMLELPEVEKSGKKSPPPPL